MKKIIISTHIKFWHRSEGGEQRVYNLLEYLYNRGNEVVLFFVGSLSNKEQAILKNEFKNIKIYTTESQYKDQIKTFLKKFKIFKKINANRKANKDFTLKDYYCVRSSEKFKQIIEIEKPDIAWIEIIRLAYLIEDNIDIIEQNNILKVIDTFDIMYERCNLFNKNNQKSWVNITKEEEIKVLSKFDTIISIQDTDRDKLKALLPDKNIISVMHKPVVEKLPFRCEEQINLTYIAASNISNVDSIRNFINKVWIELEREFGNKIQLNIYGRVCEFLSDIKVSGVNINGFAEDLRQVYKDSDIVINPVLFGSGLKIKNVEAICYGKPLVTTSIGAEGIEDGIDNAFLVGDDIQEQIKYIKMLVLNNDIRLNLSNYAYEYSRNKFSLDNIYSDLIEII